MIFIYTLNAFYGLSSGLGVICIILFAVVAVEIGFVSADSRQISNTEQQLWIQVDLP